MEKDRGNTKDQECCEEVSIDTPTVEMYRGVMIECFDAATVVMDQAELLADEGDVIELQTRIALNIFDRATRQMPAQDRIYGLALQYVSYLIQEKDADMKWSEEARASSPAPPSGGFVSVVPRCKHEGLLALRDALMVEDHLPREGHEALEAMSRKRAPDSDVDVLLCPKCLAAVRLDMVKSGQLWREPTEEEYGKPEGPSASDSPIFKTALEQVLKDGHPTMTVIHRIPTGPPAKPYDDKLEDMRIFEDVLTDPEFFETVREKHGEGHYIFMLWKKNLELHSEHHFTLAKVDQEETADEV